mmetsp:Transcript_4412/g.4875  ORF Transcript_4412/g.4875 Transcript_4412/m.4875 type:complete len:107 (-) Transcript_4412:620-940(-)
MCTLSQTSTANNHTQKRRGYSSQNYDAVVWEGDGLAYRLWSTHRQMPLWALQTKISPLMLLYNKNLIFGVMSPSLRNRTTTPDRRRRTTMMVFICVFWCTSVARFE